MHAADAAAETPRLLSRAQPAIPVITNKKDKQITKYAKVVLTEKMPKLAKEVFGKARANEDLSK